MKKFIILAVVLAISLSSKIFAKNNLDLSDTSVLLLKTFNTEGNIIRKQEPPLEKVDISEDTVRIKELKAKFHKECYPDDDNSDLTINKKNP